MLKLIIATRGSMPKARAESALWMAMSASSSAVGLGLMAQSPKMTTWSGRHMKKIEDTSWQPGLVPRICSAGRTVAAVVCDRARDQAVDLALSEHHGADRDRVGEVLAGHLLGPALVPPQLGQRGHVALGDV